MILPSLPDDYSTITKTTQNCALKGYKNQFVIRKYLFDPEIKSLIEYECSQHFHSTHLIL